MRAVLNSLWRDTGAAEPILGLSAGTDTAGHDLPVEDAGAEPLQKERDPVPRRAIGTQPRLRCFRHHGLFYLTSTTCRHPGKSICTLRQDGFQRICNGQLRLFHRIHNRSSLKGQRMFNRSSDHQCRAAKRPSLTRANRLCHYHRLSAKLQTLSRSRSRQKMPHLPLSYCLVQLRAKLRWHRLQGHLATSWLLRRPSQLTNSFFETLCRPIWLT